MIQLINESKKTFLSRNKNDGKLFFYNSHFLDLLYYLFQSIYLSYQYVYNKYKYKKYQV